MSMWRTARWFFGRRGSLGGRRLGALGQRRPGGDRGPTEPRIVELAVVNATGALEASGQLSGIDYFGRGGCRSVPAHSIRVRRVIPAVRRARSAPAREKP